jgi:preprotein translocase subunit SecD
MLASGAEKTPLAIHLICDGLVPQNKRLLLHYWSPEVARGNSDPACVLQKPELVDLTIRSARVEPDPQGIGAVAVIELGESARPLIEQMTKNNKGRLLAFVVDRRIAMIAMVTRPYSDTRILITTRSRDDAERIVSAVAP